MLEVNVFTHLFLYSMGGWLNVEPNLRKCMKIHVYFYMYQHNYKELSRWRAIPKCDGTNRTGKTLRYFLTDPNRYHKQTGNITIQNIMTQNVIKYALYPNIYHKTDVKHYNRNHYDKNVMNCVIAHELLLWMDQENCQV